MNVYLVGHGAADLEPLAGLVTHFNVPQNVKIVFYCKHTGLFDSSWEPKIRNNEAVDHGDYRLEEINGGSRCINYRLGHPGGIKSTLDWADFKAATRGDGIRPLEDGATYAVKQNGDTTGFDWYVDLETICRTATASGPVTIHWFACREQFPQDSQALEDWENTCKGMYGGKNVELAINLQKKEIQKLDSSRLKFTLPARKGPG
jgi:hypothetical protein